MPELAIDSGGLGPARGREASCTPDSNIPAVRGGSKRSARARAPCGRGSAAGGGAGQFEGRADLVLVDLAEAQRLRPAQMRVHVHQADFAAEEARALGAPEQPHRPAVVGERAVEQPQPVGAAQPGVEPSELVRFCAERIPAYMVPERFELDGSLPKTSTGKIDRQALRAAALDQAQRIAPHSV